jgi:hypothetical protein
VATRWTEDRWLAAAEGKNLRQIEDLVAGHARAAVDEAHVELGPATLDALLRAALRHCASR